jgi:hypothetical protein
MNSDLGWRLSPHQQQQRLEIVKGAYPDFVENMSTRALANVWNALRAYQNFSLDIP